MTAEALLPVGRDCECGCPLVWRQGHQWCAVYGSHPTEIMQDRSAPGAELISLCMNTNVDTKETLRARAYRARKRARAAA